MNEKQNNIDDFTNNSFDHHKNSEIDEIPNGVSMENASYIESRGNVEIKDNNNQTILISALKMKKNIPRNFLRMILSQAKAIPTMIMSTNLKNFLIRTQTKMKILKFLHF